MTLSASLNRPAGNVLRVAKTESRIHMLAFENCKIEVFFQRKEIFPFSIIPPDQGIVDDRFFQLLGIDRPFFRINDLSSRLAKPGVGGGALTLRGHGAER